MPLASAGILLYRLAAHGVEVLLVHPGGPFWAKLDEGAWTIPKGQSQAEEELQATAEREFFEETGHPISGTLLPLGSVRLKSGKVIFGFAVLGNLDPKRIHSNVFELEWPPRSGKLQHYPEVDRAGFFSLSDARTKLHPAQVPFLDRLSEHLQKLSLTSRS